jgi:hypothetical protein
MAGGGLLVQCKGDAGNQAATSRNLGSCCWVVDKHGTEWREELKEVRPMEIARVGQILALDSASCQKVKLGLEP